MNTTYKVVAQNCDTPRYTVEVEGNRFFAEACVHLLTKSFRQVDITDAETGEIVYSFYRSDEWFKPTLSTLTCLELLEALYNENRAR